MAVISRRGKGIGRRAGSTGRGAVMPEGPGAAGKAERSGRPSGTGIKRKPVTYAAFCLTQNI